MNSCLSIALQMHCVLVILNSINKYQWISIFTRPDVSSPIKACIPDFFTETFGVFPPETGHDTTNFHCLPIEATHCCRWFLGFLGGFAVPKFPETQPVSRIFLEIHFGIRENMNWLAGLWQRQESVSFLSKMNPAFRRCLFKGLKLNCWTNKLVPCLFFFQRFETCGKKGEGTQKQSNTPARIIKMKHVTKENHLLDFRCMHDKHMINLAEFHGNGN